ncbi:DnaJ domain-containing protein [Chamaesiphon sp. OTE_75_metabat_556]|uniref:DnaJ domain-containing protein n=1 Tax=Chamaesiphon sp. OTE_75_metabat_556 TaxID=2964692 RepID=UPI00286A21DB|nr:DnaJ domain-containing protein [Chamaesiphon sp. OTE_75_metabat_556]
MLVSTTNLDRCYQLLGICRGASLDELKAAYRSLARKWHPDLNPEDRDAHQRFITLNEAYQILLAGITTQIERRTAATKANSTAARSTSSTTARSTTATNNTTAKSTSSATAQSHGNRNESELKWQLYAELQSLLKQQQFLKAIVLIEGLAHHAPQDRQVCQWQGIIYSQYGHQLVRNREFDKARIYLKKALKVDPHNRQLWQEVDRAFNRITQLS